MIIDILRGATLICNLAIAVFFLRYWCDRKDSLFGFFAVAFLLMTLSTLIVACIGGVGDFIPYAYGLRLMAFLTLIVGIVNKNRPGIS